MSSDPDVVLKVEGMMCQKNCGNTVQKALSNVPGVTKAVVTFAQKEAQIWGNVASSVLVSAVANVGFDATVIAVMQQFVHKIESNEELEEELNTCPGLLIVKFEAKWCGPCKDISPLVQDLAKKHQPVVRFVSVDTDKHDDLMHQYKISSLPYFLFFKSGQQVDKVVGPNIDELAKKILRYQQGGNHSNDNSSCNSISSSTGPHTKTIQTTNPSPKTSLTQPQPLPEHEFFDIQFPAHDQWNLGMEYESRKFSYRIVRKETKASEAVSKETNASESWSVLHPAVAINALFVTVQGRTSSVRIGDVLVSINDSPLLNNPHLNVIATKSKDIKVE